MAIEKILIIDDDVVLRNLLAEVLQRTHFNVMIAESGPKALALFKDRHFDMIITDMKMSGTTGLEILKKAKEHAPDTVVLIITAFGSIENAVEAMRFGAFNYLIKPFSPDAIEAIIEKADQHLAGLEKSQSAKKALCSSINRSDFKIICESSSMKRILADLENIAHSNASVCIHGESGTGKEVIAQAIHYSSPRAIKPFIKVNCAAIPETLIESEFFGHEKGSFTGAASRRLGRFELANGGTLLLDEITETPSSFQAKLLRVTQEQEFERVGGAQLVKVNVRLISTSNRDMKEAVSQKMIREDLYYRLNVIPIFLPPLRERVEEILPLAEYFLKKFSTENQRKLKTFNEAAKKKLLAHYWPGNVRELANVIERAVIIGSSVQIDPEHLLIQ
jgi:two-component system, NtrC family, response regulator AtoC